jgi:signal recognition particle subunit SRP54
VFGYLTDKFIKLRRKLAGFGKLSPKEIEAALKEIRVSLLEADVNYLVVKDFSRRLAEAFKSETVLSSLKPADQITSIVYKELVGLLGGQPAKIEFSASLPIINLLGLQGVGKTTTAAKLGFRYRAKKPLVVACDTKRPAAAEQLRRLALRAQIDFFDSIENNTLATCAGSLQAAKANGNGLIIFDTAVRLHIDETLTRELVEIKKRFAPLCDLLVVDGMTGQDAVRQAQEFNERVGLTGTILSKLDGDERGGAALSVRWVTNLPIYFIATGEHLEDLEEFIPERIGARIMGMADVKALAEKVEQVISKAEGERFAKKALKGELTFDDLLNQLQALKRMGDVTKVAQLIPGLAGQNLDTNELAKTEAIIRSMTKAERTQPEIINGSRRRRIADGSGTTIQMVNQLLAQLRQLQALTRQMGKGKVKHGL